MMITGAMATTMIELETDLRIFPQPDFFHPFLYVARLAEAATAAAIPTGVSVGLDIAQALQVLEHGLHHRRGGIQSGCQRTDFQRSAAANFG